jgi:hypothetical protein
MNQSMTQQTGGLIMLTLSFLCFATAAALTLFAVTI